MSFISRFNITIKRLPGQLQRQCKTLHKTNVSSCVCVGRYSTDSSKPPEQLIEVYRGVLSGQIRAVKAFSLMTSATGIISQPVLYKQVTALSGSVPLTIFVGTFVGFFTFVTPLLLHTITRKYVTHIHYNPENSSYIATLLTIFLRQKKIEFRSEDIEVPDVPGMFTSFHIRGIPVFVDARQFNDMNHYIKMMGYDKPIDFTLQESSKEESGSSKT